MDSAEGEIHPCLKENIKNFGHVATPRVEGGHATLKEMDRSFKRGFGNSLWELLDNRG